MDLQEKLRLDIKDKLLFIYLVIFPFGQLLSLRLSNFNINIPLHLIDIITLAFVISFIFGSKIIPKIFIYLRNILIFLIFSYIFSFAIFPMTDLIIGGLYLIRVVIYALFFLAVYSYIGQKEKTKGILLNSLIFVCFYIAFYGILQYIFVPDIRPLTVLGWDDHLFRLVSTFIDPGFTSIFLVFGFLATLSKYLYFKEKKLLFILIIFIISLALTYSRAGYLALFFGALAELYLYKKLKKILLLIIVFAIMIYLIPSYGSEGVRLLRTRSIVARLQSYSEGIEIFKNSPVFGIGFDNLCIAKTKYLGPSTNSESHSCSGLESGFLVVLTTTGVVGFFVFIYSYIKIIRSASYNIYGITLVSSLAALFMHNLFVNSFFYPWVMGYLGILTAISIKE